MALGNWHLFSLFRKYLIVTLFLIFGSLVSFNLVAECKEAVATNKKLVIANSAKTKLHTMQAALALSKNGKYQQALQCLDDILKKYPTDSEAYFQRGLVYERMDNLDLSIGDFNQAILFSPTLVKAYMSRANCWQKKGQVDKAVGDYSKVIEFSPKYSDAYLSRGKLFAAMDDEEKAVADFDRFVSLKPRNAQVYFDLAQICWKSDNDERAVKYLDQALKYNPRYAKAYLLKALISLCDRNGADTVSNALTYINIKGLENKSVPYAYAYAYLGYRLAKKEVKAKDVLDEFLKSSNSLSWPNPIVKYLRGQISQTHLLKLANDSSKKFQAKSYIAMKAYLDNRKKNALEIFQELIDSCGDEQKTDADSSQHQPPLRRLDEYRIAKAYLDYLMLESDDRGPDDVEATETSN